MHLSMQSWNWWEKLVQQYSQTSFLSGSAQFGGSRLHVVEGCRVDCDWRARVVQRLVCAIKWMMRSTMTTRSNCLLIPCHKTHPVVNNVGAHWDYTDKTWIAAGGNARALVRAFTLELCRCGRYVVYAPRRSLEDCHLWWRNPSSDKRKIEFAWRLCLAPFVVTPRSARIPLTFVAPPPRLSIFLSRRNSPCKVVMSPASSQYNLKGADGALLQLYVFLELLSRIQDDEKWSPVA